MDREQWLFPNGNPRPGAEKAYETGLIDGAEAKIGRDPRQMTPAELRGLGHPGVLLSAVRQNCIECQGGNEAEVRRCRMVWCPMWPYRMKANPFNRRILSADEKAARAARLREQRERGAEDSP